MSYDPNFPFNNGESQNNPEPGDDHRTVPMQTNFEAPPAGFPPPDYDTPTIAYRQPEPPAVHPSQGVVQPGMALNGNMPPATTGIPRKRPSNKTLLIGGISVLVLLLLVISVLFILPNLTASASNQTTDPTSVAVTTPDANATRPANKNIYAPYLVRYRSTIRSQIAQGLHMPVDQLVSRLKGGDTLSSIASAQGISSSQLQTIVKTAFQQGFQPAIDSSNLTQKQVNTLINRMLKQPQTLDRYLNVQGRNNARPKGSATPTA